MDRQTLYQQYLQMKIQNSREIMKWNFQEQEKLLSKQKQARDLKSGLKRQKPKTESESY